MPEANPGLPKPVPLELDLGANDTVKTATWIRSGVVYTAVFVDLEWRDTYDLALYRLDATGEWWEPVWNGSFGLDGEDDAAEAWLRLLSDPASHVQPPAS